jgi:hypothetical protein
MPSRAELNLRAAKANVVSATYPNDSKFEQAIIFAEKASTATASATTILAPVTSVAQVSGGKNI